MMNANIHEAVQSDNSSTQLTLLQNNDDIPADADGNTPLHIAALYGSLANVMQLVKLKPGLAKKLNRKQSSPLHLAVDQGHNKVAEELLKADSNVCFDLDDNGLSPVHIAVKKNRIPILQAMLEARPTAALQLMAGNGNILHMCAKLNRLKALELLVKSNEEHDHFIKFRDDHDNTILHIAAINRHTEIVKFLVRQQNVDVGARNMDGLTAFEAFRHSPCMPGDEDIEEIFEDDQMGRKWKKLLYRWGQKIMEKEVVLMGVVGWVAQAIIQAISSAPASEDSNWWAFIFFTIPSIVGSLAVVTVALMLMSGVLHQRQHLIWVMPLTTITILTLFSTYGYLLYIRQMRNWKWIAALATFLLWVLVIPKELAPRMTKPRYLDDPVVVRIDS